MKTFVLFFMLASTSSWAGIPDAEADPVIQPSVGRTLLICDQWQWIGNGATTWGCLSMPRRVTVAGGQVTDDVVTSLQTQINELKDQIDALKTGAASR